MLHFSIPDIKLELTRYCAYQERCRFDIEQKVKEYELTTEQLQDVLHFLKENNFWNEARFAQLFAQGKLRINQWGKLKIRQALQQKKVEATIIQNALSTIDHTEYQQVLLKLITQKRKSLQGENHNKAQQKIIQYLSQKGFEFEIILRLISDN